MANYGPDGMVKTGWTVLKIGIHSAFGPNSPMEFGILDLEKFGQDYCTIVKNHNEIRDVCKGESDSFTCKTLKSYKNQSI